MPNQGDQPAKIETQPIGSDAAGTDHSLEKTQFFADDSSPTNTGSKSATTSDSTQSASKKTQKIVGGYRLIKLLGEGGMGRVYQAVDESGRMVAIKLLSPELSRSPEALDRFKLEGVIASAISHPHCVFVHRADEDSGTPFIAMELMTGQTLKDIVSKRGPLAYSEAIPLVLQCIDGLIEAHSRGMIHRDVKPANCYLDDQGNVKIGDFGLARSLVSDSELTRTGSFLGTPLYASPEQILGEKVDEQSDIYSLAATIYFLLAGKAPFESPHATQVIAKIVSADPPDFAEAGVEVPRKLEQVVLRGLARDRSKRYGNFHEFRDDLIQTIAKRDRVATLLRRFLAFVIDSFLISMAMGLIAIAMLAYGWQEQQFRSVANLIGTLFQGLYLLAFESLFGTTIGKRLLSLRVVDPELGTRPRFRSCLIRTSVFVALLGAIEFSSAIFLSPVNNIVWYTVVSWIGLGVGCFAILSVWKRSNRKELLHEKLSRTQTWVSTQKAALGVIDLPTPRWSITTEPIERDWDLPSSLGRFEIIGRIPTDDGTNWLLAHDSKIERSVWIQLSPDTSPPPSEAREKCVRRTRMRFLETGFQGQFRWDAYVAPDGAPIKLWFDYRNPMPWTVTQSVLLGAMEETQFTDSSPKTNSTEMSRWWLTSNGKLTLAEAAVRTLDSNAAADSKVTSNEPMPLLPELACLAIPDKNRDDRNRIQIDRTSLQRAAMPVAPLRATQLLQKMKSGKNFDPNSIRSELDKVAHGAQSVTVTMRVVHAAILSIVVFFPWLILTLAIIFTTLIPIIEVQKDARSFTTLAALLKDPENHKERLQGMDDAKRSEYLVSERIEGIEKAADERYERFSKAYKSLGFLESGMIDLMNRLVGREDFVSKPVPDFSSIASSVIDRADGKADAKKKDNFSGPQIRIGLPTNSQKVQLNQSPEPLENFVNRFERYEAERIAPAPVKWMNRTRDMLIIPLCVLVVWGGIFRGGLVHFVTGLAVVRRDGRRASIFHCMWRSLLFWAPFFLVAGTIVILDAHGTDWVWWTQQLRRVYFILPILYLVVVIRWPSRGPHDLASGTYVVPR